MKKKCSVSLLKRKDIDKALHLSTQAGWNQTEDDWIRLLELNPETCFLFRLNGQVVGSATLAIFGSDLAWIGMIIVDQNYRGMGIGKQALETVINEGRKRSFKVIGLDATDQGRTLYKEYGFYDVHPIDRWKGSLRPLHRNNTTHVLEEKHMEELLQLDLQWSGFDRSKLIRRFFDEKEVLGHGLTRDGKIRGFTFIRPGRQYRHLSPLVADTEEDYAELLDASARSLNGIPVYFDAIRRQESTDLLTQYGLRVERRLTRMTLEEPSNVLNKPKLRAAVAFEWG